MKKLLKIGFLLSFLMICTCMTFIISKSNDNTNSILSCIAINANAQPEVELSKCICGNGAYNHDDYQLFLTCICSYSTYDCCACCTRM